MNNDSKFPKNFPEKSMDMTWMPGMRFFVREETLAELLEIGLKNEEEKLLEQIRLNKQEQKSSNTDSDEVDANTLLPVL